VIHAWGVKVQPQISHPGPESLAPFFKQIQPMGPSVIRTETTKQVCREMTLEEIETVIELYGEGVRRAREAGYDGVELHAAHNYMMLGSFLSPLRNFRTDDYAGGKFEGRAKLLLDVVGRIRQKVGDDFPITVRISGFERESGGREINDTQRLAPILVEAGVDCFHVTGGVGDANITQIITGPEFHAGYNVAAATAIKQVVDVPVLVVGQNMDPVAAEAIIAEGRADLVAMGRALLADPQLPNKAREGRLREINRCTLCQGCVDIMTTEFNGAGCWVNPRAGKEGEFPLAEALVSKKVVVVGGGPGGLACAMYAAQRGHQVTLIEKEQELGGAFRLASTLFFRNQFFLDYLINRVSELPIDVRLGTEANDGLLKELDADVIVLAVGGKFSSPEIDGDQAAHVIRGPGVLDLVKRGAEGTDLGIGQTIAIIGANLIGIELAEWLATQGRRVHLIEPSGRMAMPAGKKRRSDHGKNLDRLGIPINTGVGVRKITEEDVVLVQDSGRESRLPAETVIVVGHPEVDSKVVDHLLASAGSSADQVHVLGDAGGFGLSKKAVQEAMEIAYSIGQ